MTLFRNISRVISVAAMLALVLLVSCSKVHFAGEIESVDGNMTTESLLRFNVDWTNAGDEKPAELTVLMNRIQNVTLHYAWRVDGAGNIIAPIAPADSEVPQVLAAGEAPSDDTQDNTTNDDASSDVPADDTPGTSYSIVNGLYTVMAVAACDTEDFIIPDVEQYGDSLTYKTKDLYVEIPRIPDSLRFKQNLIDLNPMCPFIRAAKPIYYVRSDNNALVSSVNESESDGYVTVSIAPEKLTHKISFRVFLRTEDPSRADGTTTEIKDSIVGVVYLDTLKAAISGIPASVQLVSGQVSDQNTGKMGFHMKKKEDTRVTDGSSPLNLYEGTYEGSVNAFGLFPSVDMEYLAGPGILNLFLYPKIYYHENGEENGKILALTRVFHASINIKKEIDEARMMTVSNKNYYIYGKEEDTELEIRTSIELSYQDVLSGTSDGLKEWTDNILNPDDNFNPGLEM